MEKQTDKSSAQQIELHSWDHSDIQSLLKNNLLASPSVYSISSSRSRKSSSSKAMSHHNHHHHNHHSQAKLHQKQRSVSNASMNSQTSNSRMEQDISGPAWTNMRGKKKSLPASLQPYINEAFGFAESQMKRSPSLRSISLVQQQQPSVEEEEKHFFRKRKQQQTELLLSFGDQRPDEKESQDKEGSSKVLPDIFVTSLGDTDSGMENGPEGATKIIWNQKPLRRSSNSLPAEMNRTAQSVLGPPGSHFQSRSPRSSFSIMPSSEDEVSHEEEVKIAKKQRFWDYLTMVASLIYAIGFTLYGLMFYLSDVFITRVHNFSGGDYFNIYLCIIGIIWLLWLIFDINNYTKMMQKYASKHSNFAFKLVEGEDGELKISIPISSKYGTLPEYYCFSNGRHSGSFFLKVGAAAFCLGHLVFIGLSLGKQIVYFVDAEVICERVETLVFTVLQPLYVFLQLFIIFKYSNVIVNRSKALARFAFMHCIMSSLCFWLSAIFNETLDSIVSKKFFYKKIYCTEGEDHKTEEEGPEVECYLPEYNNTYCSRDTDFAFETNINCLLSKMCWCADHNEIAKYIFQLGPYLYPFSIEFSILVVAIWYIMWSNIGKIEENQGNIDFLPTPRQSVELTNKPLNDAMFIYADCHSSMRGLFIGMVFTALTIIGIIVFFILTGSTDCKTQELARLVNDIFESSLLGIMLIATIWVYYMISRLEINPHPISFLDDLLLFICIPSFFLYFACSVLPGLAFDNSDLAANMVTNVLMLTQVVLQTPMIVDGLRRCSDSAENQDKKPGRNLLTFLLVANLAIYFWETMEVKNVSYQGVWKDFYGNNLWTLMSHMMLPLCIFYRFHSAVALADIWSSAYRPGDHH